MAVNIIETKGTSTFEDIHHRSDKSSPDGDNIVTDLGVIVPRFVYSKLGNWTNAKSYKLEDFQNEQNEYEFFMMQMERYAETGIDDGNIAAIDEYLGTLGIDTEYPFDDDSYSGQFTELTTGTEPRNIIYDDNGTDVNIIYNVSAVDFNVVRDVTHIIE